VYFFFLKNTKFNAGKLRTLEFHEKAYFLTNGKLETRSEMKMEVKIYAEDFCVENFYSQANGKLYMSGFVCIDEINATIPPTQKSI
jgi:hypothetical protein